MMLSLIFCLMYLPLYMVVLAQSDIEYLLNAKLTSWREDVTKEIKKEVLQETLSVLDAETKIQRKRYQQQKILLEDTRKRVASLEAENVLLRKMVTKSSSTCTCSSKDTSVMSGQESSGTRLAIGEHRSGDILIIDPVAGARWKVSSPKGILGMAYHPITKILYVVRAYTNSAIVSVNILLNRQNILRKCSLCSAIGLDTKENIIYFFQTIKKKTVLLLRLYLNTTTVYNKSLVTYSKKLIPTTLTVDDVNQRIFVVLRADGIIEERDYSGKKTREILLDSRPIDRSITLTLALNKMDNVLYFNVDDELWEKNLATDEDPELVDVAEVPRLCGLTYINNRLVVAYMDNGLVDVWTKEEGFQNWFDMGISGKSGSKHICLFY